MATLAELRLVVAVGAFRLPVIGRRGVPLDEPRRVVAATEGRIGPVAVEATKVLCDLLAAVDKMPNRDELYSIAKEVGD